MSKLSKFLDSNATKLESCSESLYYNFNGKSIRVSDHLSVDKYYDINIILPKNKSHTYILSLNSQLFIHDSFTTLKVFLESFFLIVGASIDKVVAQENQELKSHRKNLSELAKNYDKLKYKYDAVLSLGDNVIASHLTVRQLTTLRSWVISNKLHENTNS